MKVPLKNADSPYILSASSTGYAIAPDKVFFVVVVFFDKIVPIFFLFLRKNICCGTH